MSSLVRREDVEAAAARIAPYVHKTPLLTSRSASERLGVPVFFKAENLQKAGSFKARGAFNSALQLTPTELARGLLTYSSGNHGQAVAWAARRLGAPAVIVMPEDAPAVKRAACAAYGARIELAGTTSDDRRARALELAESEGLTIIEPFDAAATIAGQGTATLEIIEAAPEVTTIVAPIGGGGLIGGALAAARPERRVIGVEPELACAMARSLEAGAPTSVQPGPTIADGLKPVRPGARNFAQAQALGLEVAQVSEAAIAEALRWLFERARLVVEPSGAAAFAALLSGAVSVDGPTAVILSGGNVDPSRYAALLTGP